MADLEELIDYDSLPDEGLGVGNDQLMLDFDSETDLQTFQIETAVPVVSVTSIEPLAANDWRIIRDYVVEQIEARHGKFPRNPVQEKGIFGAFVNRWGDKSLPIAKMAFEFYQGVWHNAPISINRFCIASDPWFAAVIAKTLQ